MSSVVPASLADKILRNCSSLLVVAVGYDYCLTFSKEVTHIWQRPWTKVSTLFLLIRYMGCLSAFTGALITTTFIPGSAKTTLYFLTIWSYVFFSAGAEAVMILRVYAMYHRSRSILGVLVVMYILVLGTLLVATSVSSDPSYFLVISLQELSFPTGCDFGHPFGTQRLWIVYYIAQCISSVILCILVVTQLMRQTFQMYQATGSWQFNRYMMVLARGGVLYFVAAILYCSINIIVPLVPIPKAWMVEVLLIAAYLPLYTLNPRFVIDVRELDVLKNKGRLGSVIDTGFGLSRGAPRGVEASMTSIEPIVSQQDGTTGGLEGYDEEEEWEAWQAW